MDASAVKRVGTGQHAVICLHGWFGSADGWGYWPEVADGWAYSWWFPEMRGYGARKDETGDYTMKEYAADALAFADADGEGLFFGAPEKDENRRAIIDFTTGNRNSGHWLDAMVAFSRANSTEEAFAGAVRSWVRDDYLADVGKPET
ncbi:MAG: alpha/beta hydrolase, partial [Actinophytocola sp.]|nr:alpha/beta hydrolase [Actinophytocola sp.]